ncbi:MAG: hypothetical protein LBR51_04575 [Bacteroidales bacterium]|jgi:hypothetical protein|nr:hypothetical protein [Bacteroidales bacterium]
MTGQTIGMPQNPLSMKPQLSRQPFIPPNITPITRSPSVRDVIRDSPVLPVSENEAGYQGSSMSVSAKTTSTEPDVPVVPSTLPEQTPMPASMFPQSTVADLSQTWNDLLETVFKQLPFVLHPLKDVMPEMKDRQLVFTVKNAQIKNTFLQHRREVMAFLRTRCPDIEDVQIIVDETLPDKVIIMGAREKLQALQEQNNNMNDFLKLLELQIKE